MGLEKKYYKILVSISIFITLITISAVIFSIFRKAPLRADLSETNYKTDFHDNNLDSNLFENINKEYKFKRVVGWIASFDYQRGKNDFYKFMDKYTEVSPTFYDLNQDGSITPRSVSGDNDLITIAHKNGIKVIPTVLSFDEKPLQLISNQDDKRTEHSDFLVSEVDKYNYDGIDIDYESINIDDKEPYLKMLQDLGDKLHAKGKILSVTVVAKTNDDESSSYKETKQAQDWNRIGNFADEIRVMAYDYSPSTTMGPISPIWWVESVMKYAKSKNISDKIVIGQPLYAYAYGNKRYAYTYDEIIEILNAQKIKPQMDKNSGEKIITFKKGEEERTMYFHDSETLIKRFNLIDKYNVGGIAFWRLGGEDEDIFNKLQKQR